MTNNAGAAGHVSCRDGIPISAATFHSRTVFLKNRVQKKEEEDEESSTLGRRELVRYTGLVSRFYRYAEICPGSVLARTSAGAAAPVASDPAVTAATS